MAIFLVDGRRTMEKLTAEDCQREVTEASERIKQMIERNSENANFLKGISKFCERIKKYEHQTSKLTSAFHTFGSDTYHSKKVTNNSMLKKRIGKKIKVQPEAVK